MDNPARPGVFLKDGYKDDSHDFALQTNLENFNAYLRSIRRYNLPVTCEIGIENIPKETLISYINTLRFMLD